ncbi:four helix bundle protein [Lutibacter oceani]|uniref:Four helix bundle protein n=1 Tax=Lutibacter oceani TaxID=1853311 RepID=A0A3D9RM21_9FLAO|nr:four helix bundle protein [Lutibacter oceani]REE80949.1 four helix bundle protein [Lutibacter oceani]
MAKLNSFEDIIAWQKSRELNKVIYYITNSNTNFFKDYGLRDQLRRASVSVSSNIAEGFEEFNNLKNKISEVSKLISGFIKYLNSTL